MIRFTGHALDAVVCLTVDQDEIVARLLQRAQVEGRADDTEDVIRRRQEVYLEQTEPLIEVYRSRGIVLRDRRPRRGRRGHRTRSSTPSTSSRRADRAAVTDGTAGPRHRDQDAGADRRACARPASSSASTLELLRGARPRRHHHRRARRHRRGQHPLARARPRRSSATTASRRRSARRSTTRSCTASRVTGCWPTAT